MEESHSCVFMCKVFAIIACQACATSIIAVVMLHIKFILQLKTNLTNLVVTIAVLIVVGAIVLIGLKKFVKHHPWNCIMMVVFSLVMATAVGLPSITPRGAFLFYGVILIALATFSLTAYTFFQGKVGSAFTFLAPFRSATFVVLIGFTVLVFTSRESIIHKILGTAAAILFTAYILYSGRFFLEKFDENEYLEAAVDVYAEFYTRAEHLCSRINTGFHEHCY